MGEAIAVVFDAEPAPRAEILEHRAEIRGRIGVDAILPDANVRNVGRVLRLPQIGRARQQSGAPIGADIEALKEAEAERVVAGQPEQALLGEQQHAVEACGRHRRQETLFARRHFGG